MPGLFPATDNSREPQTPERVIVALPYYKCCVPSASDRELARVLNAITDHRIHHETVKALLERYPIWRHPEFQRLIQDYHIYLSEATIRKIMALNPRLHLAPQRPITTVEARDAREGPKKSSRPFEHTFIDLRYLDAKPAGVQLYSTLSLAGLSRTILAGSLTTQQEVGVILRVYFQALLRWGLWEQIISDHGGQFISHDFLRVNQRLGVRHDVSSGRASVAAATEEMLSRLFRLTRPLLLGHIARSLLLDLLGA